MKNNISFTILAVIALSSTPLNAANTISEGSSEVVSALQASQFPTMSVAVGSPIPDGWIIVETLWGRHTIQDVTAATYRTTTYFTATMASPIPDGFVVTQQYTGSSGGSGGSRELTCVRGAKYGFNIYAKDTSPLPTGFVILRKGGGQIYLAATDGARTHDTIRAITGTVPPKGWIVSWRGNEQEGVEIKNLIGARYRETVRAALGSPVPDGWVISGVLGSANEVTNLNGAKYLDRITVYGGSAIPAGWVNIFNGNVGITELVYLIGAKKGDEYSVKFGSPIPKGWVVITQQGSEQRIRYLG
ncbi:hypothetical protein [Rheinheimera sp.]|uniref:hypothetical protein n=1 Tax=Rheinheimera sp. TaxID=1869214 RepID=UPI003D2D9A21